MKDLENHMIIDTPNYTVYLNPDRDELDPESRAIERAMAISRAMNELSADEVIEALVESMDDDEKILRAILEDDPTALGETMLRGAKAILKRSAIKSVDSRN